MVEIRYQIAVILVVILSITLIAVSPLIYVKIHEPPLMIVYPREGMLMNSSRVPIILSCGEKPDELLLTINGILTYEFSLARVCLIGPLKDGPHRVVVNALREGRIFATAMVNFTVDTRSPLVHIEYVKVWRGIAKAEVEVGHECLESSYILIDGRFWGNVTAPRFTIIMRHLEEGEHTLRVVAVDCAGNRASTYAYFVVDRTPPEVEIIHVDSYGDIIWYANDNLTGVRSVRIYRNDSLVVELSQRQLRQITMGEHPLAVFHYSLGSPLIGGSVKVEAEDWEGNVGYDIELLSQGKCM